MAAVRDLGQGRGLPRDGGLRGGTGHPGGTGGPGGWRGAAGRGGGARMQAEVKGQRCRQGRWSCAAGREMEPCCR